MNYRLIVTYPNGALIQRNANDKIFFGETSIGNTGIVSSLGYLENPCKGNDVRTFLAAKKTIHSRMKKIVILRHCTFLR